MSRINVDKITGATGTASGAPITLSGDTLTANLGSSSTVPASIGGSMHFISKATASDSEYIEFSDLSNHSSFKNLYFIFNHVLPATNSDNFRSQIAISGTTYKTSNYLGISHDNYSDGSTHANSSGGSTGGALFHIGGVGNTQTDGNDGESDFGVTGSMTLFSPNESVKYHCSSTDFIFQYPSGYVARSNSVGKFYENNSPITAIKFFYVSGNITSGTIAMYGIKDA